MSDAKKVLVLGASGMLGSMIATELSRQEDIELTLTEVFPQVAEKVRKAFSGIDVLPFDARQPDEAVLQEQEWIINAIGIIKQNMRDGDPGDNKLAIDVNAVFPYWLGEAAERQGARVIQIATDCAYSGDKGRYVESDPHDPLDVYGKTKSLGEAPLPAMTHLRCSIIGPEAAGRRSLLEWFLGQPQGAQVTGFTNHLWNGVTTLHFARLCLGLIRNPDLKLPGLQHVVAREAMSKYDMLKAFAKGWDRGDIVINSGEGGMSVDRTLATEHPEINMALWRAAGYEQPPDVGEMIAELAAFGYRLKFD